MELCVFHCIRDNEPFSPLVLLLLFLFSLFKQTLGLEYSSVVKKKPFELLHLLLASGFDNRYKLAETYIKAFQLDTAQVNPLFDYSSGEMDPRNESFNQFYAPPLPPRSTCYIVN